VKSRIEIRIKVKNLRAVEAQNIALEVGGPWTLTIETWTLYMEP
jgi:hypothetical protein